MSLRIKICGITNAGDAVAAVEAGADALGFLDSFVPTQFGGTGTKFNWQLDATKIQASVLAARRAAAPG